MAQPLVNGVAYSWSQIQVLIAGTAVNGITAIKYAEKQEVQDNYGAGNRPVSRGHGKIETSGSLTLEMAEVEALQAAAPNGSILAIPEFTIVVSYMPETGIIRNHTLNNCRFKENKREVKSGDMTIEVEMELAISDIAWK